MLNKKWLKASTNRAIKTAAQTAIGAIGAATLITEVNWQVVLATVALSTLMSYLTSVAGLPEVKEADKNE